MTTSFALFFGVRASSQSEKCHVSARLFFGITTSTATCRFDAQFSGKIAQIKRLRFFIFIWWNVFGSLARLPLQSSSSYVFREICLAENSDAVRGVIARRFASQFVNENLIKLSRACCGRILMSWSTIHIPESCDLEAHKGNKFRGAPVGCMLAFVPVYAKASRAPKTLCCHKVARSTLESVNEKQERERASGIKGDYQR